MNQPVSRRETLRGGTVALATSVMPATPVPAALLADFFPGARSTVQACLWMGSLLAHRVDVGRLGREHFLLIPARIEAVQRLLGGREWAWEAAEDAVDFITALARLESDGFDPGRYYAAQAEPWQAQWLHMGYASQIETRNALFECSAPDRLLYLFRQKFGEGMSLTEAIGDTLRRFEAAVAGHLPRALEEAGSNLEKIHDLRLEASGLRDRMDRGAYDSALWNRRSTELDRLIDEIWNTEQRLHQAAMNHGRLVEAREWKSHFPERPELQALYDYDARPHVMRALDGALQVCDLHYFLQTVRLTFGPARKPCAPLQMGRDYALEALPDDRVQVFTAHGPLMRLLGEADLIIPARRGRPSLRIACVEDEEADG